MDIQAILQQAPVIPVLTLDHVDQALPLARALLAGGLSVLEITLRTPAGFPALQLLAQESEGWIAGAGTVTRPQEYEQVCAVGGAFAVSPGLPSNLAGAATGGPVPLLPGAMTPTEILQARDLGFQTLKLFPAEQAGGVAFLRAIAAPIPDVAFCPTGGVSPANLPDYLALPNVLCVGGSWVAPGKALAQGDWDSITRLAAAACQTARG